MTTLNFLNRDVWDRMAASYHHAEAFTGAFARHAVQLVEPFLSDVKCTGAPLRVLDVASGTGVAAVAAVQLLQARFPTIAVHATDISPAMLDQLLAKWPAVEGVTLTTAVADMQNMTSIADGSQDLVMIIFGLMFVPDVVASLREVQRVMAPGGTAVIQTWHFNSILWEIMLSLQKHLGKIADGAEDDWHAPIAKWGREDVLSRALRHAGFVISPTPRTDTATAWIHFVQRDGVPIGVDYLVSGVEEDRRDEAKAFVLTHFGDGQSTDTVPVRGTAATIVLRAPVL